MTEVRKVPPETFLPILHRLMESRGMDMQALGRRCNLIGDSLYRVFTEDRGGLDFDLCDLILCKLGVPHLWWDEPLDSIYWTIDFGERECARKGCTNKFELGRNHPKTGPRVQKFCSRTCRVAAAA